MTGLELIGSHESFRTVLDNVAAVARTNSAVLIQGETGTGKELIARAIHEKSARRGNRFVALNCAAIPPALMESQLFGHEKGAFTGAVAQTLGRFQAADRGTLFLDEIGDLPLELQPKLLRALQEKQVERVGGGHPVDVDVRVIAATNQDLESMVEEREFRADLYYRLNVFPISLPPLRERVEDIAPLSEHFVQKCAKEQGKLIDAISEDVMAVLEEYDWPGNVRELQNVMERGVILTTGPVLSPRTTESLKQKLTARVQRPVLAAPVSITTLADAERAYITAALWETNWMIGGPRGAAAQLGLPRTTLIAKMRKLGIENRSARTRAARQTPQLVRVSGQRPWSAVAL